MNTKLETHWKGNMKFEASVNNHLVLMDAPENNGGENLGPGPKSLLLAGLAGCTGMDVISILKKMKVNPDEFTISVEAGMTEEHPKVFDAIMITYRFKGTDLPEDKLRKAVELSQEKYCGVSAMLGKAARLDYEIVVE